MATSLGDRSVVTPIHIDASIILLNVRGVKTQVRRNTSARAGGPTRARIVEVAARLFVERGYAGTTIPAIAAEADVAVETVYRSASGKAGLLADAVRAAVAGGSERAEVVVTERPAIRRIAEEPDPVRQLQLYAATQPGIWSRVGPPARARRRGEQRRLAGRAPRADRRRSAERPA